MTSKSASSALFLAFAGIVTVWPSLVNAQAVDVPGFRPGQEEQRFQQPTQPKATFELMVPEGGGAAAAAEAEGIRLDLTALLVDGATVYGEDDLRPLYADLLARGNVSLADIYRLADAITTRYREDGYVLSRAIVPAQRIKGGVVRVLVVEGHVDSVAIEGDQIAAGSPCTGPSWPISRRSRRCGRRAYRRSSATC